MKKKILIILVALVFFIGGTYALIRKTVFNQNVAFSISELGAYIIYNKGTDVITGNLVDTTSYTETNLSTEITLYKNANIDIYGHIYLDLKNIGVNLSQEKALKWVIKSNNKVINNGNFIGYEIDDSIPLALNIPLSTTEQKFQIYIWLDEDSIENFDISGEQLRTIVRAEATQIPIEVEPNKPALVDGLIPVKYDDTNSVWVKADETNTNNDWYNYNDKIWANAVLVSSTNRSTYLNGEVGTPIPESDVLAYYVWIPRYKYKVWNIDKSISMTNNLNAQTQGIEILFENGMNSTGTISCNYDFSVALTDRVRNETCIGSNGDYYTHPAFSFGNDEVTGIWVGKFKISNSNNTTGGNSTSLQVTIKPNAYYWRGNYLTKYFRVIYNMQNENNIYGLNTSRLNTDSHMLKNMEWGSIAYLTHSKYGRCSDNECNEIERTTGSYTGGNDYATNINKSTTGNIYGIYDIAGGVTEYVMGNISMNNGGYVYNAKSAGSNFTYVGYEKYVDTYAYGTTSTGQIAYNRARLGDATGETKSWYGDYAYFPTYTNPWFYRGRDLNSNASYTGTFCFGLDTGSISHDSQSVRAALVSLSS